MQGTRVLGVYTHTHTRARARAIMHRTPHFNQCAVVFFARLYSLPEPLRRSPAAVSSSSCATVLSETTFPVLSVVAGSKSMHSTSPCGTEGQCSTSRGTMMNSPGLT